MVARERGIWIVVGIVIGALGVGQFFQEPRLVMAGNNDRHEDFILCTGPVAVNVNARTDGVWLLDYKAGKLLGTVIDRNTGRVVSWAEVDLVKEFGLAPKQNVHFLMTTGNITVGQGALYLAEVVTGRFGIYTMGQRPDNKPGIAIRRHDMTNFRQPS